MKRLNIIVEGLTEMEFVKELMVPYLREHGIYAVTPIVIHTSKMTRGGFVKYQHLKNEVERLLACKKSDFVVSMFVDFFCCPNLPQKEKYETIADHEQRVQFMEQIIAKDINDSRFIPYIQLHEFEALLFASNKGFEYYFSDKESQQTSEIVALYPNPEQINSSPQKSPSKRLLAIKSNYDKVIEGNLIALEIGIRQILNQCPRFKAWMESLIAACKDD